MATTTPNYGWDVPTSTDYVKDGATAIETLGDDIDASMFAALNAKPAMGVLLGTATYTASATGGNIDSVFTSTYSHYRLVGSYISSSAAYLNLRVRTAGTTRTTLYSYCEGTSAINTGQGNIRFGYNYTNSGNYTPVDILISNPASASIKTAFQGLSIGYGDSTMFNQITSGFYQTAEANDGINLAPSAGNITGTFKIYGLKDS
jgi:hypothetical protein